MRRDPKSALSPAQYGFSMVEILVTLVIVAIALLGTAGLQAYAMRVNKSGQFRTQAIFLASDLVERMEANKAQSVLGSYVVATTSAVAAAPADCSQAACNPATLAGWDINQWEQSIANLLPQPSWSVAQTVAGNPSTYSIVIVWTDRSSVNTASGETFSYTATRTIGN